MRKRVCVETTREAFCWAHKAVVGGGGGLLVSTFCKFTQTCPRATARNPTLLGEREREPRHNIRISCTTRSGLRQHVCAPFHPDNSTQASPPAHNRARTSSSNDLLLLLLGKEEEEKNKNNKYTRI